MWKIYHVVTLVALEHALKLASQLAGFEADYRVVALVALEHALKHHYNEAQRAMVGAKLKSVFEEQAKQRQVEAAKVGGGKTSEDFYEKTVTKVENKVKVNLPFQESGQSRDKAADAVGVSGKSVDFACQNT